ncbi:MAG TPA: M56 family metallopeptidase [Planctomycetaceae bacterium]|jgi:beta-lactamase regulating signal transducer with metallopeptidase domain
MNTFGLGLVWWCMQATLFLLAGLTVYVVARRRGPSVGALAASATLFVLTGVSLLAFSPWPAWWTLARPAGLSASRSAAAHKDLTGISAIPLPVARLSNADAPSPDFPTADAQPVADSIAGSVVSEGTGPAWRTVLAQMQTGLARRADADSAWRWSGIVGLLFFSGASFALVRFLTGLWVVRRYRTGSLAIADPAPAEEIRQFAAGIGFRRPIEVRQSQQLGAPATVGWRRPLVLLPPGWKGWSRDERRVVLAHEVAHVARGDYPAWLLAQLSLALHFYHPLVHWLARRLRLEQELAADVLGAEMAGGRELYLVTLTRLVLEQNASKVSFAARPFFSTRGTFLRRIEMLSAGSAMQHAPWTRRRTATLFAALALAGVIVAGVRVQSGEPVLAQADESRLAVGEKGNVSNNDAVAKTRNASSPAAAATESATEVVQKATPAQEPPKPAGDKPPVAAAKPAEKSLSLAELQTIVVDQIRSIRSLHISYTKTEPKSFGGKSQDHVWAEQGFKLLKRDVPLHTPGKSARGYAESFDGKRTYQLGYDGDEPAGTNIREDFREDFYLSVSSSLIGWLHTSGHRESIVNAIRSSSAKLVESKEGAAGASTEPTIEVTEYKRNGADNYALHVTLVLDREHGYLPKSITYYGVSNPTWQFAHEVDEFMQVRDAATGTDRWFPARGRYKQRTPEHGEQFFTTVFNKVTINEPLPDDLFVLYADSPPAAHNQEQQALADFEKAYLLAPGQLVKRIKRPYLPGRILNYKKWWGGAFAQSPYETTGTFLPAVYPERDGKLGQPSFHFVSGIESNAVPASDLINSLGAVLDLRRREVEDADRLLEQKTEGDYVIRADAPLDKLIAAFGQVLKTECGVPVDLEFREVERPVVVMSGEIKPPFVLKPETVVEFSGTNPSADAATETGTFDKFMQAVGKSIQPNRRVISEIKNYPYRNETISWRGAGPAASDDKTPDEKAARALLDRLEQQTGLTFTLTSHKFPIISAKRSK